MKSLCSIKAGAVKKSVQCKSQRLVEREGRNGLGQKSDRRYDMTKASYTVEMALLFPVILGVILFIMGLGFYMYNLSVMDMIAYDVAIEGAQWNGTSEEYIEKKLKEWGEAEIKDRLIAVKSPSVSVTVKGNQVLTVCEGKYMFPIVNSFLGGGADGKSISVSGKAKIQDSVSWIRGLRKVGKVAELLGKEK